MARKLEREPLTAEERDQQSQITPDDKLRAAEEWRRAAPSDLKKILDAK